MSKKNKKLLLGVLLGVQFMFLLGCRNMQKVEKQADKEVTLRLFSNLTDRNNGEGLLEQMLVDEYMKANPGVKIEVEALDDEAYKTKFKAYTMEGMPDIVSIWGQPAFINDVLDAGILEPLNEADYDEYGFVPGSLEGFKKEGKLYGLPRITDVSGFYYNEKMFKEHGWEIPKTYDELLQLAQEINAVGIVPVAMDGADGWPLAIYLTDILFKLSGDNAALVDEAIETGDFSSEEFIKAVSLLRKTSEAGMFQKGYETQDYGMAMNLFAQGKAAMFYMGSWETSMAMNQDIPEEVRENIRVFLMPRIEGQKAAITDIAAWNGGGYAISADSEVKEEAIRFLNFMYQPDKLSKYSWEYGIGMSAQDQTPYLSGNETEVQLQFMESVSSATGVSGTPINDRGSASFKSCLEHEIQSVSNGSISVNEFIRRIEESCN